MIVYKSILFAMRRYEYGGSGIVDMIGSLFARYATKAVLTTAAKTAMRGTLDAAKRPVPHLNAYKVATTIAAAAKKRKRVDIEANHSQEAQLKKAFVDTGDIDINALIDGSGIVFSAKKMIVESILELHETNATDESIKSYEYDEYQPITGTKELNSSGQITITIENQDQFLHQHNSYLLIEGEVLKVDNTRYADADLITVTNNGLLYLFSNLKLTLARQTVEHVNYPGQATSLLDLASYSTTFSNGCGQGWYPDTNTNVAVNNGGFYTRQGYLIRLPNPKGSFQCTIPMRHIFGLVDDYSKVTYGIRDTLQSIRKDNNDVLFRTAAAGAGKVVLSKLAWSVPIVQPNDVRKVNLYKGIAANNVIPVSFRMRQ